MSKSMTVKELRAQTGLSQSQFATRFQIPVRTLQHWEQGQQEPPSYVVAMIKCILDAEIHARWVWKEEERPKLEDNPKFIDIVKHSFKYPYAPEEMWHCSHCGKPAVEHLVPHLVGTSGRIVLDWLREKYKPDLCPNCGAKMDL